jgi:maltooligosyltrehalose trehalohydrolase
VPFLEELSRIRDEASSRAGRPIIVIAETDLNDSRILLPYDQGGLGMDAHWNDDLHHAVHAFLTGERDGYYLDYGNLSHLAKIYRDGVCYAGEYSVYHKARRGRSYDGVDSRCLVVSSQNHDQIGNRMYGRRLSSLVEFEKLKLAGACIFLSPFTPFMFMGEEMAVKNPFLYFVDHNDPDLVKAVQEGRKREFSAFAWRGEPPDPADPETYDQCILREKSPEPGSAGEAMSAYYTALSALSKTLRSTYLLHEEGYDVAFHEDTKQIALQRLSGSACFSVIFSFNDKETPCKVKPEAGETWKILLQSGDFQPGALDFYEKNLEDGMLTLPPFSATVLVKK